MTLEPRRVVVTIDGPAGSGKSTVARKIAEALRLPYLDTGAMYRWVAFQSRQEGFAESDIEEISRIASESEFSFPFRSGKFEIEVKYKASSKVLGPEIRTQEISMLTSRLSRLKKLREILIQKQREIGSQTGAVAEGRDAGTVIFPKADRKFFLTASPEVRARRRELELRARFGSQVPSFEEILKDVNQRDAQDRDRAESPMIPAPDAELIDTSELSEAQVMETLLAKIGAR